MSNAEQFYIYRPTKPIGAINVAEDALPWMYDQDPSSGFCARMLVVPADALELADKRIAELAKFHAELHVEHGKAKIRIGELERKLAVAREALKQIPHALGHDFYAAATTIADEALAQIGGEDASS